MPERPVVTYLARHCVPVLVGAAALVLAAGCAESPSAQHASAAAGGGSTHGSAVPARSSAEPAPAAGYDSTAAALGGHITGCDPQTLTPRGAAQRLHIAHADLVTSAAACTLRGRTAILLTFSDHSDQAAIERQLRSRVAYYASGTGWTAAPTDTSEPTGQQSIVQDVALALGGLIEAGVS